ncbi:hypothetical protein IFM89_008987 [Coptis chinensis]|uniref:Cupin type-1 domain-containing protein n=1 Tax=Coptis chinensis TaxID=261450 RepID=A0A835HTT6_9MAGN|nr:hypothetical protein IFM89_008987 [Coptis chinensis]
MLRQGNMGALKLALQKKGFALPRYSNSSKVAYVLQVAQPALHVILEAEREKVIAIKKGNAIALPFGVVTWWCNKDDAELVVLFLGTTFKAHKAGEFTDFFLTRTNSIFTGFSTELVDTAKTLVASQTGNGIVKLEEGATLTSAKGGGQRWHHIELFFVVSKIADNDGMEWFSIVTTPNPIFSHLAGKTSVWKALSPEVLQASFNVRPELEKQFTSKRLSDAIFFAPPK